MVIPNYGGSKESNSKKIRGIKAHSCANGGTNKNPTKLGSKRSNWAQKGVQKIYGNFTNGDGLKVRAYRQWSITRVPSPLPDACNPSNPIPDTEMTEMRWCFTLLLCTLFRLSWPKPRREQWGEVNNETCPEWVRTTNSLMRSAAFSTWQHQIWTWLDSASPP